MSDNRRIAKNSVYLYMRMLLMMGVSLYTSRVILENLGVEDFGIFSVVGGIAVLFSFFNNALSGSTQRFITVSIGKDSLEEGRKVFSMSINCHLVVCLIILLFSETIGLWFLNHELNIPLNRMYEANWVFQFTLISCLVGVLTVPYSGCIIAYENMSFFAFTSVITAVLKLAVAWMIAYSDSDKLILYAALLAGVGILMAVVNLCYCRIKFGICRYVRSRSVALFKSMLSFTGWNLFKMGAIIGVSQGNNVIVNIFGGPVASAAMSIANQVNGTVYSFMQNVQTAFNPQITKTLANEQKTECVNLINMSAKFSFMLLCFAAAPLMLQMPTVLDLWLTTVPDGTAVLCILSIVSVAFDALVGPMTTAVFAEGNIKRYQIVTSILWALAIPLAYISLKLGLAFEYILIAKIVTQFATLIYSLLYLKKVLTISIRSFIDHQLLRPMIVFLLVCAGGLYLDGYMHYGAFADLLLMVIYTSVLLAVGFMLFATTPSEKSAIKNIWNSKILHKSNA